MAKYLKPTNINRSNHPLYGTWVNMLHSCSHPKHPSYKRNRQKRITVCEEWLDFDQFVKSVGNKPKYYTFCRKDKNLGYNPDNCHWSEWGKIDIPLACNRGLVGLIRRLNNFLVTFKKVKEDLYLYSIGLPKFC